MSDLKKATLWMIKAFNDPGDSKTFYLRFVL